MAGAVITFYSYKGGVGRSFALANVAVILAQWGYRVLAVDWDIEAPGLHHYFSEFTGKLPAGVLDFIDACRIGAVIKWDEYAAPILIPHASERLFLMPAASGDRTDQTGRVQAPDWEVLYRDHDFGRRLEKLRADWVGNFDFILVDSRTGLTDFSGVTTAQLPDILAFLFTANNQSLGGSCDIAHRAMQARVNMPVDRPALLPIPIPARFDDREEYDRAHFWKERFSKELSRFFDIWVPATVDRLRLIDLITIPYIPRWSFGEELCAVLEPASSSSVRTPAQAATFVLETVAAIFANGFDNIDLLASSRDEFIHLARSGAIPRQSALAVPIRVFISSGSAASDQMIARALRSELRNRGFDTFHPPEDLLPRSKYHVEIRSEMEKCDALVLIQQGSKPDAYQIAHAREFVRQTLRTKKQRAIIPVISSAGTNPFDTTPLADYQHLVIDPKGSSLARQMDPIFERLSRLHDHNVRS